MSRALALQLLGLVAAAAGCARGAQQGPRPPSGPPAVENVSDWRSWPRVNPIRFRSKGHGYLWVDVHVPASFTANYESGGAPAPVGFRVVMAGFEDRDDGDAFGLTVMVKRPPGYDPDNGDWYYAVLAPDGRSATLEGKLEPCIGCHRHASDGDHLFGPASSDSAD